ncbi:Isochorismatase-like protein [Fomitopsis serialis]|uniref:Isochorismatase-like protein n=1 Tax=Fomitopsis serialis TaxID=139415 RepID=UPI002008C336|nr:Isochorismatase-like protein [Neoantrodia serialis]KAH9927279.1 Isochorismatase-like protein [Neoantrodia serialis]
MKSEISAQPYDWPHDGLLSPKSTALVVIDMQMDWAPPDLSTLSPRELYRSRNTSSGMGIGDAGPMGRLLVRGERGHDIIPELNPLEGEPIVDKPGRSAFAYTDFELLLKVKEVRMLIVCGVTTDDATGTALEELHAAAVNMVQHPGGIFGGVGRATC